jgi:hypothetical protein
MNMFVRGLALSLATLVAIGAVSTAAEADHRRKQRRVMVYDHYYAGPRIVHGMPGMRLFFGDYALTEEEFNALYGPGNGDSFDESYYEPEPATPKKKPVAKSVKAPNSKSQKVISTTGKKIVAAPTKTATAQPAAKSETTSTSAMSCDKAGAIVSGFGFTAVKPENCKGKIYAFNATRDGKPFSVKLDPASGELTEVKKLQ